MTVRRHLLWDPNETRISRSFTQYAQSRDCRKVLGVDSEFYFLQRQYHVRVLQQDNVHFGRLVPSPLILADTGAATISMIFLPSPTSRPVRLALQTLCLLSMLSQLGLYCCQDHCRSLLRPLWSVAFVILPIKWLFIRSLHIELAINLGLLQSLKDWSLLDRSMRWARFFPWNLNKPMVLNENWCLKKLLTGFELHKSLTQNWRSLSRRRLCSSAGRWWQRELKKPLNPHPCLCKRSQLRCNYHLSSLILPQKMSLLSTPFDATAILLYDLRSATTLGKFSTYINVVRARVMDLWTAWNCARPFLDFSSCIFTSWSCEVVSRYCLNQI